MISLKMKADFM